MFLPPVGDYALSRRTGTLFGTLTPQNTTQRYKQLRNDKAFFPLFYNTLRNVTKRYDFCPHTLRL